MNDGEAGSTEALKRLTERVRLGQCILFLGAGVHAPPPENSPFKYPEEERLPLGGRLSELLAEKYGFKNEFPEESPRDLQRVSLYVETTDGLGRNALVEFLRAELTTKRRPSPALKMLALGGHDSSVTTVAWSTDGKRLATGSNDNTAKVWDAEMRKEVLTLSGHAREVDSVAWSPDGKRLATASADGTVQVYAMDIRDLMALARQRVTAHPSEEGCKKYLHVDKCPPFPELSSR